MTRILLVEDSKLFGTLVKKQVEGQLGFAVIWAKTYEDAALCINYYKKSDFLLALLDLNLPDAPNGEIVDLVLSKDIPSVIFTGEMNGDLRERMWSMKIIDYVFKQCSQDIDYIVSLIRRIYLNRSVKILVVDDSRLFRNYIIDLLKVHQFEVIEAKDGKEALSKLDEHQDLKMIITDYEMPNMDGFELTKKIRSKYGKDKLAIVGVSSQEDKVLAARFIKNGADDFITKPIFAEEFYCRVTQTIETIENIELRVAAEKESEMAREQAIQASSAKSDFLANMSHEIRTPINAVTGLCHLALQTVLTAKQSDYLSKIQSSTESLLVIINDILDFSKIEAGKLETESVNFNLNHVLEKVANLISFKAETKDIEILFDTSRDIPRNLVGDPLRLGQVFTNLMDNAVKFTNEGEVVVTTRLAEGMETDTGEEVALKFSVRDTGIGIDKDYADRIFESFSQADGSTTRKFGGTGLGLAICHRLVEMMGGEISVESEPGKGCTFIFTAVFGRQGVEEEILQPSVKLKGKRILVVDDNEASRHILCNTLSSFMFEAIPVSSGEEALKELKNSAEKDPYDLVLMDWKLPGMSGIKSLEKIKDDSRLSNIPLVLMVSTFGSEETLQQADNIGVEAFIVKPVSDGVLFDTLMEVFGGIRVKGPKPVCHSPFDTKALAQIRGARILLVEDNEINQQVATELLENAGLQVSVASNGKEAVDIVTTSTDALFDMVFMDIQMPEMDGYEATRLIRDDPWCSELPIIAMTAHAFAGEREKCLGAGMNDHLTKPIDLKALNACLLQWIKPREREIPIPTKKVQKNDETSLPDALPGIDIQKGLEKVGGNKRLYKKLLIDFGKMFADTAMEMQQILDEADLEAGKKLAHNLKGVAGNIGATDLFETAKKFEHAFRHSSKDQFVGIMNSLRQALDTVLESIAGLREEKPQKRDPAGSGELSKERVTALINDLNNLLSRDELIEADMITNLTNQIGGSCSGEKIKQLKKHISDFNYDKAVVVLERIAESLDISISFG